MVLDVVLTAICETPSIEIASMSDTFCVRSPDMNGDGVTNFLDEFDYLPQYDAVFRWCGDFNCSGAVNLFDNFEILIDVFAGGYCPESVILDPIFLPACSSAVDKRVDSPPPPSFTGSIGMDRTGDLDCDDPYDMGTNVATTGLWDTLSVVFENVPETFGMGCVFCVQDSNTINPANVAFQFNPGIFNTTFREAYAVEVDSSIFVSYPEAKCWLASYANYALVPGNTWPVLGEFRYQFAQNGCVGFLIDGSHSAVLMEDFSRAYFDAPGGTCAPFVCADPTGVASGEDVSNENSDANANGDGVVPARGRLLGVRPNPFNPSTTIRFALNTPGEVQLAIHDIFGRRVRMLDREWREAGEHLVAWDGRADDGRELSSGIYFVQLRESGRSATETQKITLLR